MLPAEDADARGIYRLQFPVWGAFVYRIWSVDSEKDILKLGGIVNEREGI